MLTFILSNKLATRMDSLGGFMALKQAVDIALKIETVKDNLEKESGEKITWNLKEE
jgi:hypothetical protein